MYAQIAPFMSSAANVHCGYSMQVMKSMMCIEVEAYISICTIFKFYFSLSPQNCDARKNCLMHKSTMLHSLLGACLIDC